MKKIYHKDHFVQIYNNDKELISNLKKFMGAGLIGGNTCLVIASKKHTEDLNKALISSNIDILDAINKRQYILLDAKETLQKFMKNDLPDGKLFASTIYGELRGSYGSIRAFGEMVAILWQENNHTGAILLEQLWNQLVKENDLTLFCAYPRHYFNFGQSEMLQKICHLHSCSIYSRRKAISV